MRVRRLSVGVQLRGLALHRSGSRAPQPADGSARPDRPSVPLRGVGGESRRLRCSHSSRIQLHPSIWRPSAELNHSRFHRRLHRRHSQAGGEVLSGGEGRMQTCGSAMGVTAGRRILPRADGAEKGWRPSGSREYAPAVWRRIRWLVSAIPHGHLVRDGGCRNTWGDRRRDPGVELAVDGAAGHRYRACRGRVSRCVSVLAQPLAQIHLERTTVVPSRKNRHAAIAGAASAAHHAHVRDGSGPAWGQERSSISARRSHPGCNSAGVLRG